jgi:hypothetical protein
VHTRRVAIKNRALLPHTRARDRPKVAAVCASNKDTVRLQSLCDGIVLACSLNGTSTNQTSQAKPTWIFNAKESQSNIICYTGTTAGISGGTAFMAYKTIHPSILLTSHITPEIGASQGL